MELNSALDWARPRSHGALITIRKDGRPQSSDITYAMDDATFLISVTDDRAKTHNMRRDPRVVLHLTDPSSWSYLSFDGFAELTPVATAPDDDTVNQLVAYYEAVSATPHDNWDEYRDAMVSDKRLIVRFAPTSVVGQIH